MAKVPEPSPNPLAAFAKGVAVGSHGPGAGAAQVAGDIAGALVPGLGEIKAIQDIFEGTKAKDPALVVGGLVGLIPVVGAAGKAGGKAASKASTKLGQEVAEKGLGQGFKASAMQLGQIARAGVKETLADGKTRDKLAKAAEQAGERALSRLVERLSNMRARGESPQVHTRRHDTFDAARNAAFTGMEGRPDKGWHDLVSDASGRREVVGRHEAGARGFRILADAPEEGASQTSLRLYWWKGGEMQAEDLTFGIEECEASSEAVERIKEAYLNRDRSFRVRAS